MSHFHLPEAYKPPKSSKIIQSSTCLHFDNTSPRLVSTFTSTTAPGYSMPNRPLLFLYRLARVHQEAEALLWRGPDQCSRTCPLTHRQCHRNILVAIVIYIATFSLPKSFDYSGRAIQVHTKNVLSKCTVKLVLQASSLLTSSHSGQSRHCGTYPFVMQYSRSCELDTTTLPRVLCIERPLRAWFFSWRSVSL